MSGQLLDFEPDDDVLFLLNEGWNREHGTWRHPAKYGHFSTEEALEEYQLKVQHEDHLVNDMINSPPHYNQFGIEVVDILEMYFPNNPHLWNAGKYLLRSGHKGHEIEDLKKLVWYVERYIKFKEAEEDSTSKSAIDEYDKALKELNDRRHAISEFLSEQGNQGIDSREVGS